MLVTVTDIVRGKSIEIGEIIVGVRSIIGIDASTASTGISIVDVENRKILYSLCLKRGKGCSAIEYKVEFKQIMRKLLVENRGIYANVKVLVQEEPFISAMKTTSETLMMLRTSMPELIIENKEYLSNIEYHEINNKVWKKRLFAPDKCPNNSELEKKIARAKVENLYEIYKGLTQDEVDAAGIGLVASDMLNSGEGIKEKVRVTKFKYNIDFIGAVDVQSALEELQYLDVPNEVITNGIKVITLPANGNLDKKIYTDMADGDYVLLFQFTKKSAGNIVLKYRLYDLVNKYENIYGVVWRVNRKK